MDLFETTRELEYERECERKCKCKNEKENGFTEKEYFIKCCTLGELELVKSLVPRMSEFDIIMGIQMASFCPDNIWGAKKEKERMAKNIEVIQYLRTRLNMKKY